MKDLSDKILHTISEQGMRPKPRWFFVTKRWAMWASFAVTFLVGSFAASAMLFMLLDTEWQLYRDLNRGFLEHALTVLPYFWIVLVALSLALAYYNFRHTQRGYRYATYLVITVSILASFAFGSVLYASGLGTTLDRTFAKSVPFYRNFVESKGEIWSRPETGLLAGKVVTVEGTSTFSITDLKGRHWNVTNIHLETPEHPDAASGTHLELIGSEEGSSSFRVKEIRPWKGEYNEYEIDETREEQLTEHKNNKPEVQNKQHTEESGRSRQQQSDKEHGD